MAEVLSGSDVDEALAARGLSWERQGSELVKTVRRDDFVGAMSYVNEVGERAESAGHHPDIDIRWNTVVLRLSTHSAGGITAADLDLAATVDELDQDAGDGAD